MIARRSLQTIIIKPGPGVDPCQLEKFLKKMFKILLFHVKILRNNLREYKLYIL